MATAATIKKNIAKLEAALKSKATPKSLKSKLETQLVKSKAELSGLNKGSKPKTSSAKSTQTALQKLKEMVNKNKKLKTYKKSGVDLERDADRPALPIGRRTAKKSGNTYYEYRANRIDVKQPPKRYPKLEKGGYMADGGMMAHGGEISKEDIEILGIPRNKITEKEWASILRMAKYQDGATYILKDEKGLDVSPKVEYEWYIKEKMAKGGKLAEFLVTLTDEDGYEDDVIVMAEDEDDAVYKAEQLRGYESSENGVVMLTDYDGNKIEYAKGGATKKAYTYVPNKDVKELMVVLNNQLKKINGTDILDGVYLKNKAAGSSKSSSQSSSKLTADSAYDKIMAKAKEEGADKEDLENLKKEDVQKLIDAGYNMEDLYIIYIGVKSEINFECDNEVSTINGILSIGKDYVERQVNLTVDAAKGKKYELGLKYPLFNWKSIIKKYNVKNNPIIIESKRQWGADEYKIETFEIFVGDKVVFGHQTNYATYKKGKLDYETKEGNEVKDYTKVNAYQKERDSQAGFNTGYWGIVSSEKSILYDITKMLVSQKDGYVKDLDFFVNRLGGIGAEELDKNDIKYEKGGYMAKGGEMSRKGNYTGKIITTDSGDVMIGNISGYRGNGEPVYDVHNFSELRKTMLDKKGELANSKIKELIKKGGYYAKGGAMEHGLKRGDTIIDDMSWDKSVKVLNNKTGYAVVNLETGERKEMKAMGGEMHRTQE